MQAVSGSGWVRLDPRLRGDDKRARAGAERSVAAHPKCLRKNAIVRVQASAALALS